MNLESTRPGKIICWIGGAFLAMAAGFTVWDIADGDELIALLNIVTAANGAWMLYVGRREIRNARKHHEYMKSSRQHIARLLDGGA